MTTQKFSARIYKHGINPCVDVPARVGNAFAQRGYIPVNGRLNDQPIVATLVPRGGGRHRLFINGDMQRRAGVDTGDRVQVALTYDAQPRKAPMPPAFARALRDDAQARAAFARLRPSDRKDILLYLNALKRPESLQRNIARLRARWRRSSSA